MHARWRGITKKKFLKSSVFLLQKLCNHHRRAQCSPVTHKSSSSRHEGYFLATMEPSSRVAGTLESPQATLCPLAPHHLRRRCSRPSRKQVSRENGPIGPLSIRFHSLTCDRRDRARKRRAPPPAGGGAGGRRARGMASAGGAGWVGGGLDSTK